MNQKIIRLGIVGSRTFTNYALLESTILHFMKNNNVIQIITGGAKGADTLAEKFATENNIQCIVFKPDWKKSWKRAGFMRNTTIVENSDYVIAFWDGRSTGTLDTLTKCEKLNVEALIISFYNER
jgi:hypothetical protein